MPIIFACKCGKRLQAKVEQAGQRIQCPACGRALVVPSPPSEETAASSWLVDPSAEAAHQAHQVGVVTRDKASVVRLHSDKPLSRDLSVEGAITCWHCRTETPFTGKVFGRLGLGGECATFNCPQCRAHIWLGYSSHARGEGTDVYLYCPSHTREHDYQDGEVLPPPAFRVEKVLEVAPKVDTQWVHTTLPGLLQAVSHHEPYQDVSNLAAKVVEQRMNAGQLASVCKSLRQLLVKEKSTYMRAILAEALACLRDVAAGPAVQKALRDSLATDDPKDQTNMPLHDLCTLALLFGDGNGFVLAMSKGLADLPHATRARKMARELTPKDMMKLIEQEENIDAFESTLGGHNWQRVQPLLPLWVDESVIKKKDEGSWLSRIFGQKQKK